MTEPPHVRVAVDGDRASEVLETARKLADRVAVVATGPTGAPGGPYVYVTAEGQTALYEAVTPTTIERLVAAAEAGRLPTESAKAVGEESTPPRPDTGPLSVGTRCVLDGCGFHPPKSVPDPIAAEIEADPEAAFGAIEAVGFLGRGRADVAADEPLADYWRRARTADGDPVLVVQAADADPEADADRLLCAAATGRLRDATEAVAAVIGAEDVVVFVSEADSKLHDRLESVGEWQVATAPETFRVGEPTMALESLEGADRIEARRRPPGPEEWGLYGRPTVLHTPRTLLGVAELWRDPEAFDAETADPGTRIVTVGGDVNTRATVELSSDAPLSRALAATERPEAAGARFVVGGRFGGLTRSLDVPASAPALVAAGLGTEGVIEVLAPERCVVAAVGERVAFAREENCGRCVPCREGSKQLHELLRAVYEGRFDANDIRELTRTMATTSLCAFGETAARPVRTALEAFEGEFRAHARGRCPAGACEGLS